MLQKLLVFFNWGFCFVVVVVIILSTQPAVVLPSDFLHLVTLQKKTIQSAVSMLTSSAHSLNYHFLLLNEIFYPVCVTINLCLPAFMESELCSYLIVDLFLIYSVIFFQQWEAAVLFWYILDLACEKWKCLKFQDTLVLLHICSYK